MYKHTALFLLSLAFGVHLHAQDFMNGDFEINNGTVGSNYGNIPNSIFNGLLPGCNSFAPTTGGMNGSLDVLSTFSGPPLTGNWFVGIVPYPYDIFTMRLSAPLVAGNVYSISFYHRNEGHSYPLELGLSGVPDAFGDLIFTSAVAPTGNWLASPFQFVAPNNGEYICIRMQSGPQPGAWSALDHFTIEPGPCEPAIDLGADRVLCEAQPLVLDPTGTFFQSYLWSDQSTGPTLTVTQPGTYWVKGTNGVCTATDTVTVTAGEIPNVVFETDVQAGCVPLNVQFVYTGNTPGATYAWNVGDGTTFAGGDVFSHQYATAGCFDVSLTVTGAQGCSATRMLADEVCVTPAPVADFTFLPATVFVDHPQVEFTNTSTGHVNQVWNFGDGAASAEANPQHLFSVGEGADYTVWLTVVSDAGCKDSVARTVSVKFPFTVYVPNTFTPDGDFANALFTPVTAAPFDVNEYRFSIFDRWGAVLFSSRVPTQGWDGKVLGKDAPTGIYIWALSVRDPYSQHRLSQTGHVLLMK